MALRTSLIAVTFLIVCLAVATAQPPCIECSKCNGSNSCLANCKRECPKPPVTVSVETCKGYGEGAGRDSAKFACDLTLQFCNANKIQPRSYIPPPRVTLQQCGNVAYGVCQSWAQDNKKSPCGREFNGVASCSKGDFQGFYNGIVDEQCNQKAAVFDKPGK
jgi:hypothetical protein